MASVVDTNVFLHGKNLDFDEVFLVPEVLEEVKSSMGKNRLETVDYAVKEPSKSEIKIVKEKSDEINSPTSETDEKLLALASETDSVLITDDIPLQNLALHLGVDFEGFLDDSVEEKYRWEKTCESCGTSTDGACCPRCGSDSLQVKQVCCS